MGIDISKVDTQDKIQDDEKKMKIRPAKVCFSDEVTEKFLEDARSILQSGWMILGKHTEKFEKGWAAKCNRKYGVAVSCDTGAIEIVLKVLSGNRGMQEKRLARDEVIIPATSFFSVVTAIRNAGLRPVVVDIDIENGIHPTTKQIADAVTDRTLAVMGVYSGGWLPNDVEATVKMCEKKGIHYIDDVAHNHGTTLHGEPTGSFGYASMFSFFCTKTLGFGEGGMIVTDDEDFAMQCHTMRNYGRSASFSSSTAVTEGYNWRLPELECALGFRSAVEDGDRKIADRRRAAKIYDRLIREAQMPLLKPFPIPLGMQVNYYRYLVLLDSAYVKDRIKEALAERFDVNCPGNVYDMPVTRQEIFPELRHVQVPVASDYCKRHFALPMYEKMSEEEVAYVVDSLATVVKGIDEA